MYIIRIRQSKIEINNFDCIEDAVKELIKLKKENLLKNKSKLDIYEIFKKEHDTIEIEES